ncbi:S-S bond formation pathway protein [Carp edema virus]|nr:S-S bond formation pathway protein [Carp edema virus]
MQLINEEYNIKLVPAQKCQSCNADLKTLMVSEPSLFSLTISSNHNQKYIFNFFKDPHNFRFENFSYNIAKGLNILNIK